MEEKIVIVLLSEIEKKILEELQTHLGEVFNLKIKFLPMKLDLSFAFDGRRKQYLASLILERLRDFKREKTEKWIAICDIDLFAEGLNFVFGEADLEEGISIISLLRLRQSFYGLSNDKNLFLERIKKEATHEFGHLFYLGHCQNPNCVMYFSNSILDTDRKSKFFCEKCQKILQSYLEKK
jgi:archaemetzincin